MVSRTFLTFQKTENLPGNTGIYQVADGTIFYWDWTTDAQRLYVKVNGKEMDADISDGYIHNLWVHGNAVYYNVYEKNAYDKDEKIYKAVFYYPDYLTTWWVRDQLEGEKFSWTGMCRRIRNGKHYVYRMCDDPDSDGVVIDVDDSKLNAELCGTYKGKVIYRQKTEGLIYPAIHKLSDTVYVVEVDSWSGGQAFYHDCTHIIYMMNGNNELISIDLETMKFMTPLHISGYVHVLNIVGINNRKITLRAPSEMKTGMLPRAHLIAVEDQAEKNKEARKNSRTNNLNEHYIPPVITDEQLTAANRKVQELIAENEEKNKRISELEKLLIESFSEKTKQKEEHNIQAQSQAKKIDELLNEIVELKRRIDEKAVAATQMPATEIVPAESPTASGETNCNTNNRDTNTASII